MANSVKSQFKAETSARRKQLRDSIKKGEAAFAKVWNDSEFSINGVKMNFDWFRADSLLIPVSCKVALYLSGKTDRTVSSFGTRRIYN